MQTSALLFAPVLPFFFFCRNLRLLGFTPSCADGWTATDAPPAQPADLQPEHHLMMSARTASARPRVPVPALWLCQAMPSGVAVPASTSSESGGQIDQIAHRRLSRSAKSISCSEMTSAVLQADNHLIYHHSQAAPDDAQSAGSGPAIAGRFRYRYAVKLSLARRDCYTACTLPELS